MIIMIIISCLQQVMSIQNVELPYLDILRKVLEEGEQRPDRTGTGTLSLFGLHTKFDISERVPCLTSKFVPWKMVIKELIWFLHGDTDANNLKGQNVHIWDGNSSRSFLDARGLSSYKEGDIGPGYGFQWRHSGAEYKGCEEKYNDAENVGIDQIGRLISGLKSNPFSRRHFLTSWNPKDLDKMALPPCHVSAQFYVSSKRSTKDNLTLSCHLYQRSVDLFLGFPFNILSYSALTYLLCKVCGFVPGELIVSMGDAHIYNNHIEQSKYLLQRKLYDSPMLEISNGVIEKTIDQISLSDFTLHGYENAGVLHGKMS